MWFIWFYNSHKLDTLTTFRYARDPMNTYSDVTHNIQSYKMNNLSIILA